MTDTIEPKRALVVNIEGVFLGYCLSREQAHSNLHLKFIEPKDAPALGPEDYKDKISIARAMKIYQQIRVLDLPDTLRDFVVMDMGSYFLNEEGRFEEGVYYSQETALEALDDKWRGHMNPDASEEDGGWGPDDRRLLGNMEAIFKSLRAKISESGLPPKRTAKDKFQKRVDEGLHRSPFLDELWQKAQAQVAELDKKGLVPSLELSFHQTLEKVVKMITPFVDIDSKRGYFMAAFRGEGFYYLGTCVTFKDYEGGTYKAAHNAAAANLNFLMENPDEKFSVIGSGAAVCISNGKWVVAFGGVSGPVSQIIALRVAVISRFLSPRAADRIARESGNTLYGEVCLKMGRIV